MVSMSVCYPYGRAIACVCNSHDKVVNCFPTLEMEKKREVVGRQGSMAMAMNMAREMKELITEYVDIFTTNTRKIGAAPAKFKFKIKLIEGAKPVKQNPRPLHPQRREAFKKQLDDWIKEVVIEPSTSA